MMLAVDLASDWWLIVGVIVFIVVPGAIRTYLEWREDEKLRKFDEEHLMGD